MTLAAEMHAGPWSCAYESATPIRAHRTTKPASGSAYT